MANQLNDFDRLIKETYENHEFPYDSTVWDGVEKELGATSPGILDFFKSVTTGLAIAGAIFATMLIFTSDTSAPIQLTENQKTEASDGSVGDKPKSEKPEIKKQFAFEDSVEENFEQKESKSETN